MLSVTILLYSLLSIRTLPTHPCTICSRNQAIYARLPSMIVLLSACYATVTCNVCHAIVGLCYSYIQVHGVKFELRCSVSYKATQAAPSLVVQDDVARKSSRTASVLGSSNTEALARRLADTTSCAGRLSVGLELLLRPVLFGFPVQVLLEAALVLVCAGALLSLRHFVVLVVWWGLFARRSGARVVDWSLRPVFSRLLGLAAVCRNDQDTCACPR